MKKQIIASAIIISSLTNLATHAMETRLSIMDINGKQYIIKQKKSDCQPKLISVVRAAVRAQVSENFIPAHRDGLDFILDGNQPPGKIRK